GHVARRALALRRGGVAPGAHARWCALADRSRRAPVHRPRAEGRPRARAAAGPAPGRAQGARHRRPAPPRAVAARRPRPLAEPRRAHSRTARDRPGNARTRPPLPARNDLAHAVERLGDSVSDLRSGAPVLPMGAASVDALLARARAAGARITVQGLPEPRRLQDFGGEQVTRVLQEAITNASRHA